MTYKILDSLITLTGLCSKSVNHHDTHITITYLLPDNLVVVMNRLHWCGKFAVSYPKSLGQIYILKYFIIVK